jgi:hypothetical protein
MAEIVFEDISNVQTIGYDNTPRKPYWEDKSIVDCTYEQVAAVVEEYLSDREACSWSGHEKTGGAWITFAPLSPTRWELVGFHPRYKTAIVDSVYCTPKVAEAIMKMYPQVTKMVLE